MTYVQFSTCKMADEGGFTSPGRTHDSYHGRLFEEARQGEAALRRLIH